MGESSTEVHACENPCTCTSQQELSDEDVELFNCSICLELVYKPIVQACGHIFCFWCTYQAMNIRRESQCPVCRRFYKYFPRVCELLHFALAKAAPVVYERRGHEVQCTEEQRQIFSPRFLESPRHLWSPRNFEEGAGLQLQMLTLEEGAGLQLQMLTALPPTPASVVASNANVQDSNKDSSTPDSSPLAESGDVERDTVFIQGNLTVDDFACSFCKNLVYRPVVLNCGEVFCESCLKETTSKVSSCPSCCAPHPSGSVLLCLELHQYLDSAFPAEYSKRKLQQPVDNTKTSDCKIADDGDSKLDGHLHVGVGCDGCGMFPIEGDRYRCQECMEKIGFDLCGSCYNNGGSLLGRFNQEHQRNHRMERIKSGAPHFLNLNMRNSSIQRRRQQQQIVGDLDDYISSFVDY